MQLFHLTLLVLASTVIAPPPSSLSTNTNTKKVGTLVELDINSDISKSDPTIDALATWMLEAGKRPFDQNIRCKSTGADNYHCHPPKDQAYSLEQVRSAVDIVDAKLAPTGRGNKLLKEIMNKPLKTHRQSIMKNALVRGFHPGASHYYICFGDGCDFVDWLTSKQKKRLPYASFMQAPLIKRKQLRAIRMYHLEDGAVMLIVKNSAKERQEPPPEATVVQYDGDDD